MARAEAAADAGAGPAIGRSGLGLVLLFAALALLPLATAALDMPALLTLATRIVLFALAAASLDLILGRGGMASFGHAAYVGLGGYTAGILYAETGPGSLLVTAPLAMLVAGAAAAVLGALCLRTRGVQFIMITLAFAQMLFFLFVSLKAYGGDDGLILRRPDTLFGLSLRDPVVMHGVAVAALAAFTLVSARLARSRFGLVLGGIRQNEWRMRAVGISPYRTKLAAFVLAGAVAGLAGALMADQARFVSPDMLHWTRSGELMVMVILGGPRTLVGPLLGAAALIGLETLLAAWTEDWQLVLGPILVMAVLFTRGGLAALLPGGRR